MDDVAAVAPAIARDELPERRAEPTRRRARAARRYLAPNSSTIVAATNAENVYAISPGIDDPAPTAISATPTTSANADGHTNVRLNERSDARRQAISGPIPIKSSSGSPNARRKKS